MARVPAGQALPQGHLRGQPMSAQGWTILLVAGACLLALLAAGSSNKR